MSWLLDLSYGWHLVKFLIDNNLPQTLASGLNELSFHERYRVEQVVHIKDKFAENTPDIDWITALQKEGSWVVLSQDRLNKGPEREVLRRSGLTVFFLDRQWSRHKYWDKAHNLVKWWPHIIEHSDRMTGGAAFRVRWRMGAKARFEQVKL